MITNPTNNIPLPEEVEKALEAGRNNVTLLQGEATRLTRLKIQLEKDVVALNTEKSILEESISNSKELSAKLITDNQVLSDSILVAQKTLQEAKDEAITISEQITQQKADLSDKTASIKSEQEVLEVQKLELQQSILKYEQEKLEFDAKVAKLSNTIKSL